jgi:hypothetical protein
MPPTTEPLSRNSLDEAFVWILIHEKDWQALRTHTRSTDRHRRSSRFPLRARGIYRARASPADLNWFAISGSASSTSSACRDTAGGAMSVFPLSALSFPLRSLRSGHCR